MNRVISAFALGLIFALGLGIAGMTLPEKIVGFLDVTGTWDPTLIFVLGAAVGSYALAFRLTMRRKKPIFEPAFSVPTRRDLTPSLVIGSVLFGTGWGLAGYCPAPAISSIASGSIKPLFFVIAMFSGMLLFKAFENLKARATAAASGPKISTESAR